MANNGDPRMDAARRAYEALPGSERVLIGCMAKELRAWLQERCPGNPAGEGVCRERRSARYGWVVDPGHFGCYFYNRLPRLGIGLADEPAEKG